MGWNPRQLRILVALFESYPPDNKALKGRHMKQQWWFIGHLLNSGRMELRWNPLLGSLPTQLRFHVLGVEAELTTFSGGNFCSGIRKQQ